MSKYNVCLSYGSHNAISPFIASQNVVVDYTFTNLHPESLTNSEVSTGVEGTVNVDPSKAFFDNHLSEFKFNRFKAINNALFIVSVIDSSDVHRIARTMVARTNQLEEAYPNQKIVVLFLLSGHMRSRFSAGLFLNSFSISPEGADVTNISSLGFTFDLPYRELSDGDIAKALISGRIMSPEENKLH